MVEGAFYIVTMTFVALLLAWHFDGDPREIAVRTVLTPIVEQGGVISVKVVATMDQRCLVTIERAVIDSERTLRLAEPVESVREPGTSELIVRAIVPSASKPGPADYRVTMNWQCNPLQKIWPRVEQLPDLSFEIVAAKPAETSDRLPNALISKGNSP